jgi:hypothetical protein
MRSRFAAGKVSLRESFPQSLKTFALALLAARLQDKGAMSVQAISWVLDNSQSRGLSRLVLISIANHADKFGGEAYPATKTIAGEAGVSEREVRYCIAELTQLGEIKVDYKASKYGTNIYVLAKMHPAQFAMSTRQAPGTERAETRHTLAPEPSLTVKREDAPSARSHIEMIEKAIKESHKTGESADNILKRLRTKTEVPA